MLNSINKLSKKRVLFVGCSFTADCGFNEENQRLYHWPFLLSDYYDFYFCNSAIGGMSNEEIYHRTICSVEQGSYDFIVVMWSDINRKWVYVEDNNVDDYTIINAGNPTGFMSNDSLVHNYAKLHYTMFNNGYVNLTKWATNIISLVAYFETKCIPYIFIKGFDNYVSDFQKINYDTSTGFHNLTLEIEKMLDFDNRSDYYTHQKITVVQDLLNKIETFNWLHFRGQGFGASAVDRSDDLEHPGIESNKIIFNQLVEYIDKMQLLNYKSGV
jgi:hypothetical protein